ncbi:MAG: pirin family protein [Deltaproteobacteria bacterium]|nr:pirin family protein [Deltaproteobacteria bacterium]
MITVRKAHERGHADHGWLNAWHTFSFADFYDPAYSGFRDLLVINDDTVAPAKGFPTHGHRDMEIVTYVLDGAIEHKDSLGTGSVIRPGDVQRMTAGRGVRHSEFNHSPKEPLHLLQIWILPEKEGLEPSYEQKTFPAEEKRGKLRLVASRDAADGSVRIHQDARIYAGLLTKGEKASLELAKGRFSWVHVARGEVKLAGQTLKAGDGAALTNERAVELEGVDGGEVLVFDLA